MNEASSTKTWLDGVPLQFLLHEASSSFSLDGDSSADRSSIEIVYSKEIIGVVSKFSSKDPLNEDNYNVHEFIPSFVNS